MVDLSVKIGSLTFKNPLLTASGTFGYGTEFMNFHDVNLYGGIITKSLTLEPRGGNKIPRIVETNCGMLNSIGLANVGLDTFLHQILPTLQKVTTPIIVNIAGKTWEEYVDIARQLSPVSRINAIEVNISCPNVKQGGMAFGTDPDITQKVVQSIRQVYEKTIIVKLTPNVTDIGTIAQAAVKAGADALSLINTVLGMRLDIHTKKPMLGNIVGGLSGPAIKPIALAKVFQVAQAVDVPLIGIGGITCWEDVIEFLIAGAAAVEIGSWNFVDPSGPQIILEGIKNYCQKYSINKISELTNTLELDNNV
ncbi:MAG: dihydroorotate dehydrogenase [bacterium]